MTDDRRAWSVIAKMRAELQRQSIIGGIRRAVPLPDTFGRVEIVGMVDLAALADVAEQALIEAFVDADQS